MTGRGTSSLGTSVGPDGREGVNDGIVVTG